MRTPSFEAVDRCLRQNNRVKRAPVPRRQGAEPVINRELHSRGTCNTANPDAVLIFKFSLLVGGPHFDCPRRRAAVCAR